MWGNLKKCISYGLDLFDMLLFDPRAVARKLAAYPVFLRNIQRYRRLDTERRFQFSPVDISYHTYDRFSPAARVDPHYFVQDLWAARSVFASRAGYHVDIGSRVDGFVSHLLVFTRVCYIDIRPLDIGVEGFEYRRGSLTGIPFEPGSIDSLSCLHVLEHVGLGRYGDPVAPQSYRAAAEELQRVLRPGGVLLVSVPVGRERLCFDGHRVFDPQTVLDLFGRLDLVEFLLIDDAGEIVSGDRSLESARQSSYGCGLFKFTRRR
ncbi:DUF268 domain-containing protein [bacterium]|nr:DUF268 domain-containing protein [bacterium]